MRDPKLVAYDRLYYNEHRSQKRVARQNKLARARAQVDAIKSVPCMDCGGMFDPVCMDFDHRPGEVKLFNISVAVRSERQVSEATLAEIAKCDVVCANCHRLRTHRHRDHASISIRTATPQIEVNATPMLETDNLPTEADR